MQYAYSIQQNGFQQYGKYMLYAYGIWALCAMRQTKPGKAYPAI
jgi:hypothetical protein